jgi:hypothetical protein
MRDDEFEDLRARSNHHHIYESRESRLCRNQKFGPASQGRSLSSDEFLEAIRVMEKAGLLRHEGR